MQLRELARLNGTLREDDNRCGISFEGRESALGPKEPVGVGSLTVALEMTLSFFVCLFFLP